MYKPGCEFGIIGWKEMWQFFSLSLGIEQGQQRLSGHGRRLAPYSYIGFSLRVLGMIDFMSLKGYLKGA
jgi:hypothetical protein